MGRVDGPFRIGSPDSDVGSGIAAPIEEPTAGNRLSETERWGGFMPLGLGPWVGTMDLYFLSAPVTSMAMEILVPPAALMVSRTRSTLPWVVW